MVRSTFAAALAAMLVAGIHADAVAEGNCTTVDVDFMPAARAGNPYGLQIVAWVEALDGTYLETAFVTQATGTFGIGNRPGRFDFNSAPGWPYGRRTTTFPIWAHRHGLSWFEVGFQDASDSDLSHSSRQSSIENHFCRPQKPDEITDALSCASPAADVKTDKGVFDRNKTSLYPPRNDLLRAGEDSPDIETFGMLNPFDAVSQATPASGSMATLSWAVPPTLPNGDYVMWIEVSRELDQNAVYDSPAPIGIEYAGHGVPYRGQPSIVYRVPFTLAADAETTATARDYFGYGDPDGLDGIVRPPDSSITSDLPGSGAQRLQLVSDAGTTYRLRLVSKPQLDLEPPALPIAVQLASASSTSATIAFVAPGDDGTVGRVKQYEIRYVVGDALTESQFAAATPVTATVVPATGGSVQSLVIDGLLPETTYSVGIRGVDDCRNTGGLAVLTFTTPERELGSVDACFIATAAYGSVMAADVDMLRRFRDTMLRRTVLGELAIESYYTFGPAVGHVVGESDLLRHTARELLAPIVARARGVTAPAGP